MSVGIGNLNAQLSKYIGLARCGNVVLVTDRDEVIAQIIPPSPAGLRESESADRRLLARLAALGSVKLGRPRRATRPALWLEPCDEIGGIHSQRGRSNKMAR